MPSWRGSAARTRSPTRRPCVPRLGPGSGPTVPMAARRALASCGPWPPARSRRLSLQGQLPHQSSEILRGSRSGPSGRRQPCSRHWQAVSARGAASDHRPGLPAQSAAAAASPRAGGAGAPAGIRSPAGRARRAPTRMRLRAAAVGGPAKPIWGNATVAGVPGRTPAALASTAGHCARRVRTRSGRTNGVPVRRRVGRRLRASVFCGAGRASSRICRSFG